MSVKHVLLLVCVFFAAQVVWADFNYLSTYDQNGVPDNLEPERHVVPSYVMDKINMAFPEGYELPETRPDYISPSSTSNVVIEEPCNVWVVFLHEGAGYRNALGYFTYPTNRVPETIEDTHRTIVFPNASYQGSGGGLQTGDKVYLGQFQPGTTIGFFLVANGWDDGRKEVVYRNWTFHTLDHLNPESTPHLKRHCAMLHDPTHDILVMGFEDINRMQGGCDQDFNDAMYMVDVDPMTAIQEESFVEMPSWEEPVAQDIDGDGVEDTFDEFLTDNVRAFANYYPSENHYAKLAFEDYWPDRGDYDFNDLVTEIQFQEVLRPDGTLIDLVFNVKVLACGAGYENGLAVQFAEDLPVTFVEKKVNGVPVADPESEVLESGHSGEHVFRIFDCAQDHIDTNPGYRFANTEAGATPVEGDEIQVTITFYEGISPYDYTGDPMPFNPFIFRTDQRGLEIHLPNHEPTDLADVSLFGTMEDDTDYPGLLKSYLTQDNKPWAILIPESWEHPVENKGINLGYPNFVTWAMTRGFSYTDWYLTNKNVQHIWGN
jgi:LruC domain-containing protein